MVEHPSKYAADTARLRERITIGEEYVALRRHDQPIDRSLAHLAQLRATLVRLEQATGTSVPPPSHPSHLSPPAPRQVDADVPPRRWGTRRCPVCGTAHHGPWLDGSTVWCGPCATEWRRRRQRPVV